MSVGKKPRRAHIHVHSYYVLAGVLTIPISINLAQVNRNKTCEIGGKTLGKEGVSIRVEDTLSLSRTRL